MTNALTISSDPLFQHTLVQVVRENPQIFGQGSNSKGDNASDTVDNPACIETKWFGLPILFDEVFAGLYRLGRFTAASFLQVSPDVAVHAKLLTGGLVPLCVTLASEDIFRAFLSANKSDALLHGHSYTAHAVGCNVAVDSVQTMMKMEQNGDWDEYRKSWMLADNSDGQQKTVPEVWSSWSQGFVNDLSHAETVESVFALGSVLSITLRDLTGAGGESLLA